MQKKKPIWSGDNFDTTAYLYYQGKDSSQLQTTRYIGKAKMIASTGEIAHLTIPNITTMPRERLWVYPEIKEINRHGTRSIISRIIQWLAGLFVVSPTADTKSQGYTPLYPTDETGSVYKYAMNHEKRSLGQDNDIKYHKRRVDSLQHHHPKINNVIMYGVSRGAATTFSALSQHQYQNVKLCIFEGIPATISAQFKFYFSNFLGKLLYNNFFVRHFIGTKHSTAKEKQAMAHIECFPDDIPILVVSSRNDAIVQHKSSFNLALGVAAKRVAMRNAGQKVAPVYFLQLDHSGHNEYHKPHVSTDAERYQNCVHAIYKKHQLPFIEEYALLGETELQTAELSDGLLKEQVQLHALFKKDHKNRTEIRETAFQQLRETLHSIDNSASKKRAINMCSSMTLYSSFFGKNALKKTLKHKEDTSLNSRPY